MCNHLIKTIINHGNKLAEMSDSLPTLNQK